MEEVLEKAGLTSNESRVYLALIKLRSALAGEVTKATGVHRRTVYDAIERLIQKGLVSYVLHGTRRYFQAEGPERLLQIVKEKEEELKSALPQLKALYAGGRESPEARIFRGTSGLKSVMDDQLENSKGEILVFGKYGLFEDILKYYKSSFERKRKEKKIFLRIVFDESDRGKPKTKELVNVKYLHGFWNGPVQTNVYGDKVAIIIWTESPVIFLIESKDAAEAYRKHFELLWKSAKK